MHLRFQFFSKIVADGTHNFEINVANSNSAQLNEVDKQFLMMLKKKLKKKCDKSFFHKTEIPSC